MSLLIKGIDKLSQLEIDADKDWAAKGVSNIKEVVLGMTKGDMVVKGDSILQRLQPGTISRVLTSAGSGHIPVWMPGAALEVWIPSMFELSHDESLVTVDADKEIAAAIASSHVQNYADDPANNLRRLDKAVGLVDAEAITAVDQTHNKNSPLASELAFRYAVGGAVLDENGVGQTDYTAEINSAAVNDVQLLPTTVAGLTVGDCFYFGFAAKWRQLWLNIGVPAVGNFALAHEYYHTDTTWHALPDIIDNTSEFTVAGTKNMKWSDPANWGLLVIQAMNLYWIRARVTAVASYTTQPLGTQGWCEVLA